MNAADIQIFQDGDVWRIREWGGRVWNMGFTSRINASVYLFQKTGILI
jgi:hypothetical protein